MAVIQFDFDAFVLAFPAFVNVPPPQLQIYWDMATAFISDRPQWCLKLSTQIYYIQLMTAHIAQLAANIAAGDTPGIVTGAAIDKISVTLQPPPETNQWQYWLNLTPYGQMLLALLQVGAVGGFYAGGFPERLAFRR